MNRRALLLAGGSALALGACRGRDDDADAGAPVSETSQQGDRELLRELLDVKLAAIRHYSGRHAPEGFVDIEREHLRRLGRALADRGGGTYADSPAPGGSAGRRHALDRMIDVEDTSIAVLIDAIPKFGDPELRSLAAQLLAVEAQQLSVLRRRAGFPPLSDAFVYGRRAL